MFELRTGDPGHVFLIGRLDAAEADRAEPAFRKIPQSVTVDCSALDYISSAGIGVLIELSKRLEAAGHTVTFVRMLPRVRQIFAYAGLDRVLRIE